MLSSLFIPVALLVILLSACSPAPASNAQRPTASTQVPKDVTVSTLLSAKLSDAVLASWGSSVCDGWGAAETGWVWQLENSLAGRGPQFWHQSTPGHKTEDKENPSEQQKVVGADFVKSYGGKVQLIPFLEGHSTTSIERKIVEAAKA